MIEVRPAPGGPVRAGDEQTVAGRPLGSAEANGLFDNLPDLPVPPTTSTETPRVGKSAPNPSVRVDLPVLEEEDAAPPVSAVGPLTVVHHAPKGTTADTRQAVTVTFSRPMVPLSHLGAHGSCPVRITPMPPGLWRWVSPDTLRFEHVDGLPGATEFTVTVPAGMKDAHGTALADSVTWTFRTPAPAPVRLYPEADTELKDRPEICLVFNQPVEAMRVAEATRLRVGGRDVQGMPLPREAWPAEVVAELGTEPADRVVVLRFEVVLPRLVPELTVAAGLEGLQGPLRSDTPFVRTFRARGPLTLLPIVPGKQRDDVPVLTFNRPLDPEVDPASYVHVTPEPEDLVLVAEETNLVLYGDFDHLTDYVVTVDAGLPDSYGDRLAEAVVRNHPEERRANMWRSLSHRIVFPRTGARRLTVVTQSCAELLVRMKEVIPEDWAAFEDPKQKTESIGRLLEERRIVLDAGGDVISTDIDFSEAAVGAARMVLVEMEARAVEHDGKKQEPYQEISGASWVQFTDLGLDLIEAGDELLARTYDLATAAPRAGVALTLSDRSGTWVTDAAGWARVPFSESEYVYVTAEHGEDVSFAVHKTWRGQEKSRYGVFLTQDRRVYRPGETVHAAGWVRAFDGPLPRVPRMPRDLEKVQWTAYDGKDKIVGEGFWSVDERGRYAGTVDLPTWSNLGDGRLVVRADDDPIVQAIETVTIQEFRTPNFQVDLALSSPSVVMGTSGDVTAVAQYYGGGSLPGASVLWHVQAEPRTFRPPGLTDYHFGRDPYSIFPRFAGRDDDTGWSQTVLGQTDASGAHRVDMRFVTAPDGGSYELTYTAEVRDVDNQTWTASTTQWVHPAEVYVGLKPERRAVGVGEQVVISAVTTTPNGDPVAGLVHLIVQRGDDVDGEVVMDTQAAGEGTMPLAFTFLPEKAGAYTVTAEVVDAEGRRSLTRDALYVWGGDPAEAGHRDYASLTRNKNAYQVGDTAEILVKAPIAPSVGVLLVIGDKLLVHQTFEMPTRSHRVSLPITRDMVGGVHVYVVLTAREPAGVSEGRASQIEGRTFFRVSKDQYRLSCEVIPALDRVRPGAETDIDVVVRDAAGHPVAHADIILTAVDDAVADLGRALSYEAVNVFYPFPAGMFSFQGFRTPRPFSVHRGWYGTLYAYGRSYGRGSHRAPTPTLRANFQPLAAFQTDGVTDAKGRWRAHVRLPDNLTRYRLVAVAATETCFGWGTGALEAGLPLTVRATAPRFLNTGDRFSMALVLQNLSDQEETVDVGLRARGLILKDETARRVTVPAHGRVRVLLDAEAGSPGEAVFQAAVRGETGHDAVQLVLPIYTPTALEGFAHYGTLEDGAVGLPLQVPEEVLTDYGGLSVAISSSAASHLGGAATFLRDNPHLGAEQRASRLLALTALGDLAAFDPTWSEKEVDACIREDIAELDAMHQSSGGFGLWGRSDANHPFVSVHVAHALLRAQQAGYRLPGILWNWTTGYLDTLSEHIPESYDPRARAAILAYGAFVDRLAGREVRPLTDILDMVPPEAHSPETLGWLLAAADGDAPSESLLRLIENRTEITAGKALLRGDGWPGRCFTLFSPGRGQAVVLQALLHTRPDHPLVPKLAAGLIDAGRNGRRPNTQEDAQMLIAMAAYLQQFEAEIPNFQAGVWLGDHLMAEAAFLDRETDDRSVNLPMKQLTGYAGKPMVIGKAGIGRLYYRAALTYAPADLQTAPTSAGFWVVRTLEALDDRDDVRQDADGTWVVREGARVRVVTEVTVMGPRDHVVVTVPLPAGLEAIQTSLNHQRSAGDGPTGRIWRHHNLRDDRAEAIATRLEEGTYRFAFSARAVTPGAYRAAPAKAEELYHDETFGRTGTDRVVITRR